MPLSPMRDVGCREELPTSKSPYKYGSSGHLNGRILREEEEFLQFPSLFAIISFRGTYFWSSTQDDTRLEKFTSSILCPFGIVCKRDTEGPLSLILGTLRV